MAKIVNITAREILDSRGIPTIETQVFLDTGIFAKASVPSGASTGIHEALELRDNDNNRYHGKGVLTAVNNVKNKLSPLLSGMEVTKQREIDLKMIEADGTYNKANFGANSILSVSLAVARAGASVLNLPLYKYIKDISVNNKNFSSVIPMFNVINGGLHGSGNLSFQEFLLIPDRSKTYNEALQIGTELYVDIKKYLKEKKLTYSVGDEGGFTPNLNENREVLDLLLNIIKNSKFQYGKDVHLGLDLAASQYYKKSCYHVSINDNKGLDTNEYIDYLEKLKSEYDLISLEDPLTEDDWKVWSRLTKIIGNNTRIIGDDLLVTNKLRLEKAINEKACNSILIKVNQIGTLSETLEVIKSAKEANFTVIVSHRSGETNDDFISDLAVGAGADFVKFGAPARGERVAKYNRLLEIYQELQINQ